MNGTERAALPEQTPASQAAASAGPHRSLPISPWPFGTRIVDALNTAIKRVPWWLVYAVGLFPGAWVFYLGLTDQLGADPVKVLERELGEWALILLIVGLAVSPLRQIIGLNLLRHRRAIGLLAFYYAVFHVAAYVLLDQVLDWGAIWADIVKRPYIMVGIASLLLLIPLALTSSDAAIKRMGSKGWSRLHKLVYVAAALAALHFILLVKAWPLEPLIYAALVAGLVAYRLVQKVRRRDRPVRAK